MAKKTAVKESVEYTIRHMEPALRKALKAKANEDDKTMNQFILDALSKSVPEWNKK